MNTKHTPGPWVAWDDGVTIGMSEADGGEPLAVAEVLDYGDLVPPGQLAADQRLIAAAPDLLAACDALTLWNDGYADRDLNACIALAVAAIAKATGQ